MAHRTPLLVLAALSAVSFGAGCSGNNPAASPGHDAGTDTGVPPGADAGPEASADSGGGLDADITDPAALPAPSGGQGVQLLTPSFAVGAGSEVQNCYFFHVSDLETAAGLPSNQPLEVHRVQVVETKEPHHMNVFRVRTVVNLNPANGPVTGLNGGGECFKSSNWADWPLVTNTQQAGDQDWSYPDGVANELQPDEWLMLQTHYVNGSTQATPGGGQVAVNLWTMAASDVTAQLGTLFATDQNIAVCQSNPKPTYQSGCQFNSATPVTIVGANGHFHSRGTEFDMFTWDGTSITTPPATDQFYKSTTWSDPPMAHFPALDIQVPAHGGVWYSCEYQWQPPPDGLTCATLDSFDQMKHPAQPQADCCYTFGPIVEENEHCNAFVYYYPKQDNVTCM